MANENPGSDDDGPAPDPFEAELIAYLDGELDAATARKVEARLATDPAARARAAELKKSFDLLDYLPKPEPSPNFTTRTLDKLPAMQGAAGTEQPTAAARAADPKAQPVPSTSMPIPLADSGDDLDEDTDEEMDHKEPRESQARPVPARVSGRAPRPVLKLVASFTAVALCAVLGYFATAAVRSALFAPRDKEDETKVEVDPRVIENLPLYAVADDLAFVTELAKPDYFGDDPAVAYDPLLKIPPGDTTDKPTGKQFEALAKSFRALPAARRAEIVKLDQELHDLDPATRDRHLRALEAYAVWLEHLPEAERRGVMTAATPGLRQGVIRQLRAKQWEDALPPSVRARPELVDRWRDDEALRRERAAFVRQHAEAFAANKSLWPFDTEAGRAAVMDYARDVMKVDDSKKCRLNGEELAEYRRLLQVAQRDQAWAWYGLFVYEFATHHPYLPDSESQRLMMTDVSDLPGGVALLVKKGGPSPKLKAQIGRWPEFPLEVHREVSKEWDRLERLKFPPVGPMPALGPAKYDDLRPALRTFADKELFPKMTGDEKRELQRVQGKWPEYPQRFVQYAHKYDLAVPGVTLPYSPKKWDATYGTRATSPRPKEKERERD